MQDKVIQKETKTILLLSTIVFSLLNVALVGTIYISIITLDIERSEISLPFWVFLMSIGTFPVVCSLSIIFSWILFAKSYYSKARFVSLLPIVNIAVAFLIWVFLA